MKGSVGGRVKLLVHWPVHHQRVTWICHFLPLAAWCTVEKHIPLDIWLYVSQPALLSVPVSSPCSLLPGHTLFPRSSILLLSTRCPRTAPLIHTLVPPRLVTCASPPAPHSLISLHFIFQLTSFVPCQIYTMCFMSCSLAPVFCYFSVLLDTCYLSVLDHFALCFLDFGFFACFPCFDPCLPQHPVRFLYLLFVIKITELHLLYVCKALMLHTPVH